MRLLRLFSALIFCLVCFNTSLAGDLLNSIRKLVKKSPATIEIRGDFLLLSVKKRHTYRKMKLKCAEVPLYRLKFKGDLVEKERVTCSYITRNNIKNAVIIWDERNNLKEVRLLPPEKGLKNLK